MRNLLYVFIGVVGFVLLATVTCFFRLSKSDDTFRGTVEDIDLGCAADGVCEMKVSGQTVIFGKGGSSGPWGGLQNMGDIWSDPGTYMGEEVEVYAKRIEGESETWYTLEGTTDYYIKPVEK